jgi:aminoglycoside phosphotransferase (APT) family kinase protein
VPTRVVLALIDGDRVLITDDGDLPSFVHDDPYVNDTRVLSHVGADHYVGPRIRLGKGEFLQPVGIRNGPLPDGPWRLVRELDSDVGRAAALAADEYAGRPPAHRPAWFRPGWFDRVEAWVDHWLATVARRRTGPARIDRMWALSAVLRVPTDHGDTWFKATCDHFRAEPAITRTLARHFPDLVPVLIAEDDGPAWMLMEPLDGTGWQDELTGAELALAPRFAEVQVASIDLRDELVAAGCPDRGLESTLRDWAAVLADSLELPGLTDDEIAASREVAPRVESLVREFWGCGLPDTLSHGDLHGGNLAYDGAGLRVFDWTDACLSHPLLDAGHLARFNAESHGGADAAGPDLAVLAAFADRWRAEFPGADIDRALALVPLVNLVFQAVTYEAILRAVEPASRWSLSGVIEKTLRRLPDVVADLD